MSNENNNEAKVIDMTSENENEIKATVDKYAGLHSDDLNEEQLREFCEALRSLAAMQEFERNELSETNANLIAERNSLMEKVSTLENELEKMTEQAARLRKYWRQEENKAIALKQIVRSIPINSYISAKELLNSIVENM